MRPCGFEVLLTHGGDALDGVSALLAWREVREVSLSCRAAFASRLRWHFLRRARVVVPPSSATSDTLLRGGATTFRVAGHGHAVRCLTVAHTACLEPSRTASCAWLAGVEQLTVDPHRFVLPPSLATATIDVALVAATIPHLRELSLASLTQLADVSPLARLDRLRHLDLSGTAVMDLAPLASLEQLEYLDISSTRVATLAPLEKLGGLQNLVLDLAGTSCQLAPLATWSNIPWLRIKKVRCKGSLDALEKDLLAIAPRIVEFASRGFAFQWRSADNGYEGRSELLSSMRNVESLTIAGALLVYRLDMLQSLERLRVLDVSTLRSSDISALSVLQTLEEVSLTSDKCIDLTPLALLPRLRSLYCHGGDPDSMVEEAHPHKIQLSHLKLLDASNHYLPRLHGLDQLEELSVYMWSGDSLLLPQGCARSLSKLRLNGDVDLREIHHRFPQLVALELQQCVSFNPQDLVLFDSLESLTLLDPRTSAVLPRMPMPQLRRLCIRGADMKRISYSMVSSIPNIHELDLEKTAVDDISAIEVLQRLELVNLKDTPVRDVTPLLMIPSLVTAILPKSAQCMPLVAAYHEATTVMALREVLHPTKNCLWGPHHRQRPRKAAERVQVTAESTSTTEGSELTERIGRCSVV